MRILIYGLNYAPELDGYGQVHRRDGGGIAAAGA